MVELANHQDPFKVELFCSGWSVLSMTLGPSMIWPENKMNNGIIQSEMSQGVSHKYCMTSLYMESDKAEPIKKS